MTLAVDAVTGRIEEVEIVCSIGSGPPRDVPEMETLRTGGVWICFVDFAKA